MTINQRSRVEGVLHRQMPVSIKVRAADPDGDGDAPGSDLMRMTITCSSEIPYLRTGWWEDDWIEVLGHKPEECDLSRFNGGAGVLLANHDRYTAIGNTPLAGIGAIEAARLVGDKLEVDIAISRREALNDLRQDILDDLVRNVSIGYLINERVLVKQGKDGTADEYRVTNWLPYEVSLVDIPADASVGLGRSLDAPDPKNPEVRYRVISLDPPTAGETSTVQGERTMPQVVETPAGQNTADSLAAERERARDILAIGNQFKVRELADQHIDQGTSVDAFRKLVLDQLQESGRLRQAESPEIGMSERDLREFSLCRVLLAAADPANARKLAPFEMECSEEAQSKRDSGDARQKERQSAITIPPDVLSRGIMVNHVAAAAAAQRLIGNARARSAQYQQMIRDLNVGSATAGGNLVATELLGSSFIDLLRNAMVLDALGVTWLRGLNGNVAIPSQTGAATTYWLDEGGAPTESQQTIGQVAMTPKTIGAYTDYTRRLLLQSSLDVEAFVRMDLAVQLALGIQSAALTGTGANNQPTGLLNTVGIGSVAGGTNGAAPTYEHMVDLETAVANANADVGNLAYLSNTKVRGKLRKTQEFASTNGKAVWTSGSEPGVGDVLGYTARVTNAMPSNLDKGSATGVCSAIAFGNWSDMVIGMWGGLDIMLDPYANATSGGRRVIALQDVDIALRHVGSFAAMKDALTS